MSTQTLLIVLAILLLIILIPHLVGYLEVAHWLR